MNACAVALVLLMDASLSMSVQDFQNQMEGTASAFEDSAIVQLIQSNPGGIAVSAFTFEQTTNLEIPWVIVRNENDARLLASRVRAIPHRFGSDTLIGPAINRAAEYMAETPCEPDEHVIDVSTDGEVYAPPVAAARDAAQEAGIKINAIGVSQRRSDLYEFLFTNVRTYNGFAIAVDTWEQFINAIRRKISMEIASR
jgi:hypothetical protein